MSELPVINEYSVIEPPTGGAVRERVFDAIRDRSLLQLVILGAHEVPTPEPKDIELQIRAMHHPESGDMVVSGTTPEGGIVNITIAEDLAAPATASIVE